MTWQVEIGDRFGSMVATENKRLLGSWTTFKCEACNAAVVTTVYTIKNDIDKGHTGCLACNKVEARCATDPARVAEIESRRLKRIAVTAARVAEERRLRSEAMAARQTERANRHAEKERLRRAKSDRRGAARKPVAKGDQFGRLVAVCDVPKSRDKGEWLCISCGAPRTISASVLNNYISKGSSGCLACDRQDSDAQRAERKAAAIKSRKAAVKPRKLKPTGWRGWRWNDDTLGALAHDERVRRLTMTFRHPPRKWLPEPSPGYEDCIRAMEDAG